LIVHALSRNLCTRGSVNHKNYTIRYSSVPVIGRSSLESCSPYSDTENPVAIGIGGSDLWRALLLHRVGAPFRVVSPADFQYNTTNATPGRYRQRNNWVRIHGPSPLCRLTSCIPSAYKVPVRAYWCKDSKLCLSFPAIPLPLSRLSLPVLNSYSKAEVPNPSAGCVHH
jgi:hypothetical protein